MNYQIPKLLDDNDLWFSGYISYNFDETEVNPYPLDSYEHLKWSEGYLAAKKDECRINCEN